MARTGLKQRVEALENGDSSQFKPWHCVVQDVGETEQQAFARYETENGPIGDDRGVLRVIIR